MEGEKESERERTLNLRLINSVKVYMQAEAILWQKQTSLLPLHLNTLLYSQKYWQELTLTVGDAYINVLTYMYSIQ